jgi:hypothetical protein
MVRERLRTSRPLLRVRFPAGRSNYSAIPNSCIPEGIMAKPQSENAAGRIVGDRWFRPCDEPSDPGEPGFSDLISLLAYARLDEPGRLRVRIVEALRAGNQPLARMLRDSLLELRIWHRAHRS